MNIDMNYNISDGHLSGRVFGIVVDCYAGSGGRSGTKTTGAYNQLLANNAFATHVHHGAHVYGPLPQGLYQMVPHERDAHMVRLNPLKANIMYGRAGFLIHGRGKIGSHGCIVPFDFHQVLKICRAVSQAVHAGMTPTLKVVATGTDLEAKMKLAQSLV